MERQVGVLAIQGDFAAHARAVGRLGAHVIRVLRDQDLDGIDALIIPGGESTTIAKGLARLGLHAPLQRRIAAGLPVLGTCAGAILLAREVVNHPVPVLGAIDVTAERNAYGTQVDSFAAVVDDDAAVDLAGLRCVFIRAPRLRDPGPAVEILARVAGHAVLVRQGNALAATFHPELSADTRIHRMLLDQSAVPARGSKEVGTAQVHGSRFECD